MIYRIAYSHVMFDRIQRVGPSQKGDTPKGINPKKTLYDYENLFEPIGVVPSWPSCTLYKAPILPPWRMPKTMFYSMKFGVLPDIFPGCALCVSEKARNIIEQFDDFNHQFQPLDIVDPQGNSLACMPYFSMNIRCHLHIQSSQLPFREVDFYASTTERAFIPLLSHNY